MEADRDVIRRVDKLEEKADGLKGEIDAVQRRVENLELQTGRITSHVESEIGAARKDLGRIESRLFGKDDEVDGGKIGFINKRIYRMEIWFLAIISAAGIILILIAFYQFVIRAAESSK